MKCGTRRDRRCDANEDEGGGRHRGILGALLGRLPVAGILVPIYFEVSKYSLVPSGLELYRKL